MHNSGAIFKVNDATALAHLGALDEAQAMVQAALDSSIIRSERHLDRDHHLDRELVKLVEAVAESGRVEDAAEVINRIGEPFYRSQALMNLAKGFARRGDLTRAINTAKRCDRNEHRLSAYGATLTEYCKTQDAQIAEVLDKKKGGSTNLWEFK